MNAEMADKIGHYKREVKKLNEKVEQLTADKKGLQLLCAEQQDSISRLNERLKSIKEN